MKKSKSLKKTAKINKVRKDLSLLYLGFLVVFALFIAFLMSAIYSEAKTVNPVLSFSRPEVMGLKKAITPKSKPTNKPSATSTFFRPVSGGKTLYVPIVYYHYIGNNPNPKDTARYALEVTPDKFESQMSALAQSGYTPISFDTMYAALKGGQLPAKPIILTFDDGYVDFYLNAFPVLKRYNFHATSFIPTGLVGTGYYLNWNQIKEMDSSGLISFEAHSVTHPNLVALSLDQARSQIVQSKLTLQQELGKPVNFFAYPYGTSNGMIWQMVKDAGFLGGAGTWAGKWESESDIYDMPRIRVNSNWTGTDLLRYI